MAKEAHDGNFMKRDHVTSLLNKLGWFKINKQPELTKLYVFSNTRASCRVRTVLYSRIVEQPTVGQSGKDVTLTPSLEEQRLVKKRIQSQAHKK